MAERFMSTCPSDMGRMRSSPPNDRHIAARASVPGQR
jgi:hypothetical protein